MSWPCEVIQLGTLPHECGIRLTYEAGGRPFVAIITGPDKIYKWARTFVRFFSQTPSGKTDGRLQAVVPFAGLGSNKPVALDISWGPVKRDEVRAGTCLLRGFFIADNRVEPYLWPVDELVVRALVIEKRLPPLAVVTTVARAHERARITWDEEV